MQEPIINRDPGDEQPEPGSLEKSIDDDFLVPSWWTLEDEEANDS